MSGDSINLTGGAERPNGHGSDILTIERECGGDCRIHCSSDLGGKVIMTTTEFCAAGGGLRSGNTLEALRDLMLAIQEEQKLEPKKVYLFATEAQAFNAKPTEKPIRRISDEPQGFMEVSLLPQNSCLLTCRQRARSGCLMEPTECTVKFHALSEKIWRTMQGLVKSMKKDNKENPIAWDDDWHSPSSLVYLKLS